MSDVNKINDQQLEDVTGGRIRVIRNSDAGYANIRSGAGMDYEVLLTLNNGREVDTTGKVKYADGFDWCQIYLDNGDYGWVAAHFLKNG